MKCSGGVLFQALLAVAAASSFAQQPASPGPAVPVEPIAAILDAFRSHAVVAIPGPHGNEQLQAFELSLIRDPRFAAMVNDIVVEDGNARYQDLMDRFVRGDNVPYESLRQVWQNTTQVNPDLPLAEEFFRAVRAVNASLPSERRLRVLLGDPPIDWDSVHSVEDHRKWLAMRETYPADLIRAEVLARQRRALVIYGLMHFQRKNAAANFESEGQAASLVSLLESARATKVFSIWWSTDAENLQGGGAPWRVPSLAVVRGTALGMEDFQFEGPRFTIRDGKVDFSSPIPRNQWRSMRTEDQYDAVLYLGPRSAMTTARVAPALCADPAYMQMRFRRMALVGFPQAEADRLKQYCASAVPK
jgi:hypothetical protein